MNKLIIYDARTDDMRPATQTDIDRLVKINRAYGEIVTLAKTAELTHLRTEILRIKEATRKELSE